jgi:hypothetical protein
LLLANATCTALRDGDETRTDEANAQLISDAVVNGGALQVESS